MKVILSFVFGAAVVVLAGCGTTPKHLTLADVHPSAPGTAIYNPTNNTTTISNQGFTMVILGNETNEMFYFGSMPHAVPATIFERLYRQGSPQTAVAVEYMGQKDGYAYLRITSIPLQKPKHRTEEIIYVKLTDLDPAVRDLLPPNPTVPH